jgi:LacI family transcriptional regulator
MTVTMKDIARGLGVSVVTVSKALRNNSDVGAETRQRVLQRIKELNYRPNAAARALVTGRTNLIGLIVPDLVHPFFSQVAKAISVALRAQRYGLIISSSEDDPELECREIEQMLGRHVDAIILASTRTTPENVARIEDSNVPYVLLDRKVSGTVSNFVGTDDVLAGSLATNHLLDVGCKTIAHLAGSDISTSLDRQRGYSMALAHRGIELSSDYIVRCGSGDGTGEAAGYSGMQSLLKLNPLPDGVFCFNDSVAMGAMRAVLEGRLQIPKDIAIIGCGNFPYDDLLRVPLSSIDQDSDGLGARAGKLAVSVVMKSKKVVSPKAVLLGSKLIVRASSARLAKSIEP